MENYQETSFSPALAFTLQNELSTDRCNKAASITRNTCASDRHALLPTVCTHRERAGLLWGVQDVFQGAKQENCIEVCLDSLSHRYLFSLARHYFQKKCIRGPAAKHRVTVRSLVSCNRRVHSVLSGTTAVSTAQTEVPSPLSSRQPACL